MQKITIVDYGAGNLGSMQNMFKKIGFPAEISNNPEEILKADKIILPGVGAFDNGMEKLNQSGLRTALDEAILKKGTPILGVCLGMQLLTKSSEEGVLDGLGWIPAKTIKFQLEDKGLKVPHMGWNEIIIKNESPLLSEFTGVGDRFYFVHSYHVVCEKVENILLTAKYGVEFTCGIVFDNIYGVQFHPEKSHKFGMKLLTNFAQKV